MNNDINGEGAFYWKDGRIYIGNWYDNKMNGYGIFIWPDKKKYYGNYKNNLKEGFGIFYWNDGYRFEGFWKEGKRNGYGFIYGNNGNKYGFWNEGKLQEKIVLSNSIKRKIKYYELLALINLNRNKSAEDLINDQINKYGNIDKDANNDFDCFNVDDCQIEKDINHKILLQIGQVFIYCRNQNYEKAENKLLDIIKNNYNGNEDISRYYYKLMIYVLSSQNKKNKTINLINEKICESKEQKEYNIFMLNIEKYEKQINDGSSSQDTNFNSKYKERNTKHE